MTRKLINIDIDYISNLILPLLKSYKQIAGAYIFGSSLEFCRPDSDIDLAILLKPEKVTEKQAEILTETILQKLPHIQKHTFDLIIINRVSAIFAHRIIAQGKKIFSADEDYVRSFMEKTSRIRAENYPRYRKALEEIIGS